MKRLTLAALILAAMPAFGEGDSEKLLEMQRALNQPPDHSDTATQTRMQSEQGRFQPLRHDRDSAYLEKVRRRLGNGDTSRTERDQSS